MLRLRAFACFFLSPASRRLRSLFTNQTRCLIMLRLSLHINTISHLQTKEQALIGKKHKLLSIIKHTFRIIENIGASCF